jgi:type I restriction enzyme R subunit
VKKARTATAEGTPTVLLIVDRTELEGQLSGWVSRLFAESKGSAVVVETARSRERLQELLAADFRGLIISMIHKFDNLPANLNLRRDIHVLVDEAHRTTGGDLGNYLMGALPNATFIGFTGTPIDRTATGAGTFKVFGFQDESGYLDKYPIAESIQDRTTLKLRHALAPGELVLDKELLEKEFLNLAETEGVSDVDDLNRALDRAVHLKSFLKADDRVEKVARFVADHFRENVEPLGYKAFLVAVDREACAKYKVALDQLLPPGFVEAVYTSNPSDPVERPLVKRVQLAEDAEKRVRKEFPKADGGPKILIVTDKLLTGYDAPILYCMYLDKPMRDHVLLQATARVNRPYVDAKGVEKPCGVIIDFVGILKDLRKALSFDSRDYAGVIEGLDDLYTRFEKLMTGPVRPYLYRREGGNADEALEKMLYERLFPKKAREAFVDLFLELQTLYEILSPSARLRPHIEAYNEVADLFAAHRVAYAGSTSFLADLSHKTAALVQEKARAHGLDRLTRVVEFDEAALDALRKKNGDDERNVINLTRSLQDASTTEKEPFLISIAERAAAIMENLEERKTSTEKAREELEALMQERIEARKARKASGLDDQTFAVAWALKGEGIERAEELAQEIGNAYARFPNAGQNSDEKRQLKAAIYKALMPLSRGKRMVELAERVLRAGES